MMRLANTGSIGFNGAMMASVLARATSRVLIALIGMGLSGAACEISSSGNDRKARLEKLEQIEEANRVSEKMERLILRDEQAFKARYEGRIVPGLGCDVCPDICELTDLRAMDAEDYKGAYRQVAADLFWNVRGDQASDIAPYERQRLLCIARREPALRDALAQLYNNRDELPMVRLLTARDALVEGFGSDEPKRALHEVAECDDFVMSGAARGTITAYEQLGWPGE